ncbi:hypothetical protein SAMN02745121_04497 [Nannocystis exedens]|uniref:Uncharacterized protein n=1 Tax=Nannocystis exedens TaxID=54 RepID=A0A1I2B0Z0_9BACT|nr:hypothetical protein [Nannocystis exedens]PCC74398.1 hypothetical protein NAEX_07489 [Nannocystis exedens]SFE49677.1 hypothetical protein SAMN02745121_04497 [Nannocystis exedens]
MFRNICGSTLALGLGLGVLIAATPGCENDVCGLECPLEGLAEGNASISGIASVDAFFAAVVGFDKAALEVKAGVDAELRAIAVSLALDAGASAADIRAALSAKFETAIDGGLKVKYAPPRCTVDAKVAIDASAKCDAEIDPGMASVECKGTCTVDASASASCDASAKVMCKGTAPELQCSGSCTGTCELGGDLQCNGTCNGECDGTCSVTGADGQCAGECMGKCMGSCELQAGAHCDGNCQGSCEYEAPDGQCEAGAEVRCQAAADASAQCDGSCDGEVVPPKAKAECEASVEAEAKMQAQCTPPSLEILWQWKAGFDELERAKFKAWVEGFRLRYAGLLAASARAELVLGAGAGLGDAAVDLLASLPGDLAGDPRASFGLPCALAELEAVGTLIQSGSGALSGSVTAVGEISAALAGG